MTSTTHLRYEVLRTARNWRFLGFTLALPLVLYLAVASAELHARVDGVAFPLYYMTGMAAYGALFAAISPGARIALDRTTGWTRLLRITPLRVRTYIVSKAIAAYLLALPSLLLLFLAGVALGVRLNATQWLGMTGLLLIGLTPFVVMGIILGHLAAPDTAGPAMAGLVAFFALLGGAYGRFFTSGFMLTLGRLLPSYWLVQAGKGASDGSGWPIDGWLVVAVWTVALIVMAIPLYRWGSAGR